MTILPRLLCSPVKWKFFIQPMNLIDFVSLLPFYIALVFIALEDLSDIGKAGKIIRLLKVMRILRVYKLFRHFAGLQALLYTLKQAYKELGLLLIIIGATFNVPILLHCRSGNP
jgi:potassium voltage-gated channel delayed-rectifier subfamily S protein 3